MDGTNVSKEQMHLVLLRSPYCPRQVNKKKEKKEQEMGAGSVNLPLSEFVCLPFSVVVCFTEIG